MPVEAFERKLVAVLAADIPAIADWSGWTRKGPSHVLRSLRREVINPASATHRGRIVKTTGDGMLIEFQSPVDVVRCSVLVQQATAGARGWFATGVPHRLQGSAFKSRRYRDPVRAEWHRDPTADMRRAGPALNAVI